MQMPRDTASSEVLLEHGIHLLAALGADAAAAAIESAVASRQEALIAAAAGRSAADHAVIAAGALADAAEIDLEDAIRRVEARALELVRKNRELDPYARLFPANLRGALAPLGRAQAAEALRIADLIAPPAGVRLPGVTDEIAALAADVRAKASALTVRVASVEAAEASASAAYGAELSVRRAWREQYRKAHALLVVLYPSDKRRVEAFFRAPKKGNGKRREPAGPAVGRA